MYSTLLLLLAWPLIVALSGTILLRGRLRRPVRFFCLAILVCIVLEAGLSGGYLPIVAGWDLYGVAVKIVFGFLVLLVLFKLDRRNTGRR